MGLSSRHHYVPKFVINAFADDDNLIFVYDKQKKATVGRKRSAKTIFFESDRNTRFFGGEANDNLEKLYEQIDTLLAIGYHDLLNRKAINEDNFFPVVMLFSSLRWRIPAKDEALLSLETHIGLDDLPIRILADGVDIRNNPEMRARFESSETFQDSLRFTLPAMPFCRYPCFRTVLK